MAQEQKQELLPIGTRVTHWDGDPGTHGKGTIIGYNGVQPSRYLQTNFKDAVEMADKVGLLDGLVNSMYDGQRCPYIVQFDPRPDGGDELDAKVRAKYPRGYRDVYEVDSVRPYPNAEQPLNIFPHDWCRILGRRWDEANKSWTPWLLVSEEIYTQWGERPEIKNDWQFVVRSLPENPKLRNSPADGSFVPMSKPEGGCYLDGFIPPPGIFVEFLVHDVAEPQRGITAQLTQQGPWNKCETVFHVVEEDKKRVYFISDVASWRELANLKDFTPGMLSYLGDIVPEAKHL